MKRLYVFGDSFMTRDPEYPGRHWSEMLSEYNAVIRAESGCSNSMIIYQLFDNLEQKPDAVVISVTGEMRLNFDMSVEGQVEHHGRLWYNNGAVNYITPDQKLAYKYYSATVSERMLLLETYFMLRGAFLTLEKLQIPYAWSPGLFDNHISRPRCQTDDWIKLLGEFEPKKIKLNLAEYRNFKDSPGFHVDDIQWQSQFAQQAQEIILKQVDFYKK